MTDCLFPVGRFKEIKTDKFGNLHKEYKGYIACKSWRCPHCRIIKKNRLVTRIRYGFENRRVRMITLTLDFEIEENIIMKYFNRFNASLKKYLRTHGKRYRYRYALVKEFQERGVRHIHLAVDVFIPVALIRHLWGLASDGHGMRVYVTGTKSGKNKVRSPAGYLSKYMGKAADNELFLKGERRYSFSRDFPKVDNLVKWDFEVYPDINYHINKESKYYVDFYNNCQLLGDRYAISWLNYVTY